MTTHSANHPARILARREVEARTGLSRSYIYKLSKDSAFPKPVKLTEYRIGWIESEIQAWIEQRIRARDAA